MDCKYLCICVTVMHANDMFIGILMPSRLFSVPSVYICVGGMAECTCVCNW